jgi:hypothetical protein
MQELGDRRVALLRQLVMVENGVALVGRVGNVPLASIKNRIGLCANVAAETSASTKEVPLPGRQIIACADRSRRLTVVTTLWCSASGI